MIKSLSTNWVSAVLALLFTLLLFFNANAQLSLTSTDSTSSVYDETVYNVPVQIEYDQDKYFVSGYEETVTVHLSSANRVQLNIEANEDTRNFQVVADLTTSALGTSEVQLRVKGLSSAVTAEIDPDTITVTIENKVTKTVEVKAKLPDALESEGYEIESTEITPKTVDITTGEETAKAIDKVVAPLTNESTVVEKLEQTVNVQALDSKGQTLSIESPSPQVKVVANLTLPSKEVGLSVSQTGTLPSSVSQYTYSLATQKVVIKGPQSVIDAIDLIELSIDISSIKSTTTKKITVPVSDKYIVSPKEVEVTITPIVSDSYSSTSQQTTTSSSGKASTTTSSSQDQVDSSSSSDSSNDQNSKNSGATNGNSDS